MIPAALLTEGIWLLSLFHRPWADHATVFLLFFAAAFGVYVLALRRSQTHPPSLRLIWTAGLLFRATVFFSPPTLSDDIHRYAWDGRVQNAGINPYLHPPEHPALAFLRNGDYPGINHKSIPTLYPPLAQAVFRATAALSPSLTAQRGAFILFDVLLMFLLPAALRRRGIPPARALGYAWNPLVLVEFSSSGHLDSLGLLCLIGGFFFWDTQRPRTAGLFWGLSFLGKLGSALLVPWLLFRAQGRRALWFFAAVVGIGYALYLTPPLSEWPHSLFTGTQTYARDWSFNAGIYALISQGTQAPGLWIRATLGLLALGVGFWSGRRTPDPLAHTALLLTVVLSLSPVVHPWYAVWLVPFLCFYPHPAGIAFTGLVAMSYLVLPVYRSTGVWALPAWVPWVEYMPSFLLLGFSRFVVKYWGIQTGTFFKEGR